MCWTAFQAKNNIWSAPAGSALTLVSNRSHNAHTANHHICAKGERNGVQRRTKVIFGKTMMWTLELLRLAKTHISGRNDVEQWRNQACNYSHYWVMLVWRHYSVSQSVSQSVEKLLNRKFLKFHHNLMQRFRVDLKTFLGLTKPNQCSQTIRKQISSWFWGDNFGPKSLNLHDSYIVLLYYTIRLSVTQKMLRNYKKIFVHCNNGKKDGWWD